MPARASLRQTLAQPNYGLYVAGNSVSLVGNWMQRTATGWLAWELSHQSFWVGLVVMADLIPALVVGPFGGVLADRADRRRIMIVTQSSLCVIAGLMAALAAMGGLMLPGLVALVALHGTVVGINQPARLALIPALVGRDHLPTAIALNSIIFNGARFVGPGAAGFLIAAHGVPAALLGNALSYLVFILTLALMRPDTAPLPGRHGRVLAEIGEGIRFVAGHRAIGPLFLLFIGSAVTVRPLAELLPGLADQVFGGGPETLAYLSSTLGLGAVVGGLLTMQAAAGEQVRLAVLAALAAAGAGAAVAASPNLPLALLSIAAFGAALLIGGVAAQTVMQMAAPAQLRGRVMSLFGIVFRGGPALGAVAIGALADLWSLRAAVLIGAAAMVAVWVPIYRRRSGVARALEEAQEN